ncbi:MAG: sugar kinase, partial [Myroides sp.]|nr:sugar kinase [Myroides sp.]
MQFNSHLDIVTFGEAMAMFIAAETGSLAEVSSFIKRPAGAELNVAIGLARLGFNVAWMSRIGTDSFGTFILDVLKKEKIQTALVTLDNEHPTGFQLKSKVADGSDPTVEYFRKGSAASYLSPTDLNKTYCATAKHLHITGVVAAISESSYQLSDYFVDFMRSEGKTISFDPNLRPSLWKNAEIMKKRINHLAFKSDWFLPGIKEGSILTGLQSEKDIADFYLEQGVNAII